MKILQVNSSINLTGASTKLAEAVVAKLKSTNTDATVTVRDLALTINPMVDAFSFEALRTPEAERTPKQQARVAADDMLIKELKEADVVVIGAPMYNFAVPSQLKNWIDAVCRSGVTFKYSEAGAEGLLTGKKVYVTLSRGGIYKDTANDLMVPYLKMVLGFLGMTDVTFIYAEGLAMGQDTADAAMSSAMVEIENLVK